MTESSMGCMREGIARTYEVIRPTSGGRRWWMWTLPISDSTPCVGVLVCGANTTAVALP